jgi:hypothetical protein
MHSLLSGYKSNNSIFMGVRMIRFLSSCLLSNSYKATISNGWTLKICRILLRILGNFSALCKMVTIRYVAIAIPISFFTVFGRMPKQCLGRRTSFEKSKAA